MFAESEIEYNGIRVRVHIGEFGSTVEFGDQTFWPEGPLGNTNDEGVVDRLSELSSSELVELIIGLLVNQWQ